SDATVAMMKGYGAVKAHQEEGCVYVAIPFGNGSFDFEVILPPENIDLLRSGQFPETVALLRDCAVEGYVKVRLPRITISREIPLGNILDNMGDWDILENAHYTLFSEPVSAAIRLSQYADMVLDETGVKVETVSDGSLAPTSPPIPNVDEVTVNRPFLFMVTERSTGTVILAGRIMNLP
ncbi:MAG: hypothetical protein K2G69_04160, partial [Muribaculaceae bacterium]|nr:hypothetical protein [Muribaculaceae bacterium]